MADFGWALSNYHEFGNVTAREPLVRRYGKLGGLVTAFPISHGKNIASFPQCEENRDAAVAGGDLCASERACCYRLMEIGHNNTANPMKSLPYRSP
jgi:hypothetical protein